ncbi:hypothetical protein [Pontibacillus yanchengensis]|uniref:Uncharacterized protein n=1 Tax=Pontibacillus yanchengensis Y32 TaxID=1385514 RepID=A0A0A2TFL9_9BACI|nr:hypothetical protein [Pontibacillus yanchengensis]KGP74657.1 hypothetical protein N782_00070 [Pontibacillus yanchengensis Y32]
MLLRISAINATTIEVTFDDGTTQEFTVDELSPNVDNERTVTYDGEEYTVTVEFEEAVATELNVLNTQFPLRDDVVVSYQLLDQYGTEVDADSSDLTVTAYNVTKGESIKAANISTSDDKVQLDLDAAGVELEDEVRVTLLHNDSGVKETVTLPVVAAEAVSEVTLGEPVLDEDVERLPENSEDITLDYSAVDQYGNDVTLENTDDLTFLSSDESVVASSSIEVVQNDDDEWVLSFDTQDVAEAKDVTITALVNATGETSQTTFTVYADASIESADLTKPEESTFAVGDSATLNISAMDQYEDALTNEEIFNQKGDISLTSSNTSVIANDDFTINEDGTVTVDLTGNTAGTTTIFATVGGETAELTVEVESARVPAEIGFVTNPADKLITGAQTPLELTLIDQYGNTVADEANADYNVELAVDQAGLDVVDSNGNVVLDSSSNLTKTVPVENILNGEYTVTSSTTGEYSLTATLQDATDSDAELDSVDTDVEVIADNAEGLSYSVEEFDTLYAEGSADQGYDVPVTVTATDADGNSVAVPTSAIQDIISDDPSVVAVDTGNQEIYGVAEGTATLTVVIQTSDGVKTLTKEVTVSEETPKAQSIAVNSDSISDSETNVEGSLLDNSTELYFTVTDQYGVTNEITPSNYYVTGIEDNSDNSATFDSDSIDISSDDLTITNGEAGVGDKFTITAVTSNGKSVNSTITLTSVTSN